MKGKLFMPSYHVQGFMDAVEIFNSQNHNYEAIVSATELPLEENDNCVFFQVDIEIRGGLEAGIILGRYWKKYE